MGIGKTSVCQLLKTKLQNSIFLDGDWCWDMHPFQVTEETKEMVIDNICYQLNNFIRCSAYDNVILGWVMHKQTIIDEILSRVNTTNCDVKALIETNLEIPNSNTEMLVKFIDKLHQQTAKNSIEWDSNGGALCFLQEKYTTLGLITEEDDVAVYHPDHLNQDLKWVLTDDIFACRSVVKDKQLVIIPFNTEKIEKINYDFIFVWSTGDKTASGGTRYHWEKAFYTADDRYGELQAHAEALYNAIQAQDCDAKVPPVAKSIISDYLK